MFLEKKAVFVYGGEYLICSLGPTREHFCSSLFPLTCFPFLPPPLLLSIAFFLRSNRFLHITARRKRIPYSILNPWRLAQEDRVSWVSFMNQTYAKSLSIFWVWPNQLIISQNFIFTLPRSSIALITLQIDPSIRGCN